MQQPKVLVLDIETAPALGDVWGLWQQNVGLNQLRKSGYMMSWAAKWLGNKKVYYADTSRNGEADERAMLLKLLPLLEEADMMIAHNGDNFDMKWIRARCLLHGLPPIPPIKQIDTLKIAKGSFRLLSNKLEYIAKFLGCEEKDKHKEFPGHELWTECMRGNQRAWREMKLYNMQDVRTLEEVYIKLRPWAKQHPNLGVFMEADVPVCPKCGGQHMNKRGYSYTNVSKFQRYRCMDCGGWARSRVSEFPKSKRKALLAHAL